jgi:murein DD-endopeptidase MepM/ murein hydrolase activator NlpD
MPSKTHARKAFKTKSLYHRRPVRLTLHYMQQRSSFWIAAFMMIAFMAGNMVGNLGWYAFWKSVLGKEDDSIVAYTGMVTPVELVPDYTRWAAYGGKSGEHTFREVPKDVLIPLPAYVSSEQKQNFDGSIAGDIYSIGHMGSYETGAEGEGSHPGVDIRLPKGTPVRAVANGIVERVTEDSGGYGKYIVLRIPHVPDPVNPKRETTLHVTYAHLSAQLVAEGDIIRKGQQIGLSGQTGFASGPHLHFQIDRDDAPWVPYWPFTGEETRAASMSFIQAVNSGFHQDRIADYGVNPMLYVQSHVNDTGSSTVIAMEKSFSAAPRKTARELRLDRLQQRMTRRGMTVVRRETLALATPAELTTPASSSSTSQMPASSSSAAPSTPTVAASSSSQIVSQVEVNHDGSFSGREWETLHITLRDSAGQVVTNPILEKDLVLLLAYGEAEFRQQILTVKDFIQGHAEVHMLPRGRRTVVIEVRNAPTPTLAAPMRYVEQ